MTPEFPEEIYLVKRPGLKRHSPKVLDSRWYGFFDKNIENICEPYVPKKDMEAKDKEIAKLKGDIEK